jgi:hypothetical protein
MSKKLSAGEKAELLHILQIRFEKNMHRHEGIKWVQVMKKLEGYADQGEEKLWSLYEMERTGGEPDVIKDNAKAGEYTFFDCSAESPKGRRSICYDQQALDARKENKPAHSAMEMAKEMGIELLTEEQYRTLQSYHQDKNYFDMKTSSWIMTPAAIRKLGGALFADFRYGTVFVYHNGAESYYAARGFRGLLRI